MSSAADGRDFLIARELHLPACCVIRGQRGLRGVGCVAPRRCGCIALRVRGLPLPVRPEPEQAFPPACAQILEFVGSPGHGVHAVFQIARRRGLVERSGARYTPPSFLLIESNSASATFASRPRRNTGNRGSRRGTRTASRRIRLRPGLSRQHIADAPLISARQLAAAVFARTGAPPLARRVGSGLYWFHVSSGGRHTPRGSGPSRPAPF